MRTSLKISRGAQLLGCVFLIAGIVSCSNKGDPQTMTYSFMAGGLLIIGARIHEWMTRE